MQDTVTANAHGTPQRDPARGPCPRAERSCILVAGMHRSGTSAFTRVISLHGASLPDRLQPGAANDNPKGFWEPLEVMQLHEAMLAATRSSWDDLASIPPAWFASAPALPFRQQAEAFLQRELADSSLLVIKDPRVCRFLPFWIPILQDLRVQPRIVIPVRNPLEIAASLHRRDGIPPVRSLLVWLRYVLDAERDSRHTPRAFAHYEDLLRDWRGVMSGLARDLGLAWPTDSDAVAPQIGEYLCDLDRHNRATAEDLRGRDDVPHVVKTAYDALLAATAGRPEGLSDLLDAARTHVDAFDAAYRSLVEGLQVRAREHQQKSDALAADLGKAVAYVETLHQAITDRDTRTTELDAQVAHQNAEIAHQQAETARLTAQATEAAERLAATEQVLQREYRQHERLAGQVTAARQRAEALARELLRRDERIDVLEDALARAQREGVDRQRAYDDLVQHVTSVQQSLDQRSRQLATASGFLARELARAHLAASCPWTGVKLALRSLVRWGSWVVRGRMMQRLRHLRRRGAIDRSGYFDPAYYLLANPEVAAAGTDPLWHYLLYGAAENRRPNAFFDPEYYRSRYPDVASCGAEPLWHYIHHGSAERRRPCADFDPAYYLQHNPDVAATGVEPLWHYVWHGRFEHRPARRPDLLDELPHLADAAHPYERFLQAEAELLAANRDLHRAELAAFPHRPRFSIVVPVYNPPLEVLERAIASVEAQLYDRWELVLVDDASPEPHVARALQRASDRDSRIRVHHRPANGNISAATNDGIAMATGDFVVFMDHDDELREDCLFHLARRLNDAPDADLLYSDQDKISPDHVRYEPQFKPDWSPEYLRGVMYLGHVLAVRRTLLDEVGGCDGRFDGVQDFELALRLTERTDRIEHVPHVLYHWRSLPHSTAAQSHSRQDELQELAVQEHLDRLGIRGIAKGLGGHRVHVVPTDRTDWPKVSILILTRGRMAVFGRCIETFFEKTTYPNFEILVGDHQIEEPACRDLIAAHGIRTVPLEGEFHFSAFCNTLAREATGEYLLMLNDDTEIIESDWLQHLVLHAEAPGVGAVGPLLLFGDGTVQHAGIILGPRGTGDHVMRGFPADSDGYFGSLRCTREVSAVTGGCLLIARKRYEELGGFREVFQRHYEDVDLCLRLRAMGLRNVYVGSTRLIHHEAKTRGPQYNYTDRILLLDFWEEMIERRDPYYGPHFDPERCDYTLGLGGLRA